jgi:ketosteroid isomerase-like protein
MSQENVEIVRRVFEEFKTGLARGDPAAAFDSGMVAPDLEWIPFSGLPGPESYRGRDRFVEFMRTWTEDFDDWSIEIERLIEGVGDRVVALLHQSATGQGSGVPVELHFATVYELEAGRVIRMVNYADPAEALEAAGPKE